MNKIDVEEIIKKSKDLVSKDKFFRELARLTDSLDLLKKSKNDNVNSILSEWIIIRLVSLWEYHFKSIIIELIDVDELDYSEDVKLSLNDLKKIQKTK